MLKSSQGFRQSSHPVCYGLVLNAYHKFISLNTLVPHQQLCFRTLWGPSQQSRITECGPSKALALCYFWYHLASWLSCMQQATLHVHITIDRATPVSRLRPLQNVSRNKPFSSWVAFVRFLSESQGKSLICSIKGFPEFTVIQIQIIQSRSLLAVDNSVGYNLLVNMICKLFKLTSASELDVYTVCPKSFGWKQAVVFLFK